MHHWLILSHWFGFQQYSPDTNSRGGSAREISPVAASEIFTHRRMWRIGAASPHANGSVNVASQSVSQSVNTYIIQRDHGRRLARLVAHATHVPRQRTRVRLPALVPLLRVTPPLLPCFLSHSSAILSIKPEKAKKIFKKKLKKRDHICQWNVKLQTQKKKCLLMYCGLPWAKVLKQHGGYWLLNHTFLLTTSLITLRCEWTTGSALTFFSTLPYTLLVSAIRSK